VGADGIERVDVDGGPVGQRLDLAFAQVLTGGAFERGRGLVERSSRCFRCGQAAQPMGVPLGGQVQRCVGRIQVVMAAVPVGQPGDGDLPEHGAQPAAVSVLDRAMTHPVDIEHIGQAGLSLRAQVKVVLEQPPEQIASGDLEAVFEPGMGARLPRRRPARPPPHRSIPATW